MASSVVAFEKFERWKNSRTVLNFTVLTNEGAVEHIWTGRIISVVPEMSRVGFVDDVTRDGAEFVFLDASFRMEGRTVEVSRLELGVVRIEEVLVM